MDTDEAFGRPQREPVRITSLRLRSRRPVADDSILILASLVGGAIIGCIAALL